MTQITLYRGSEEIITELQVDPDTGEIGTDFPLDLLAKRNPIGTAAFVLNSLANAEMIDAHIKLMTAKKRALTNNAERAKEALKQVMQLTGTLSLKSADGTFKAVLHKERDASVEVLDEKQLPPDYLREVPAQYVPDKGLIRKAIEDGFDVPGAKIAKKDRLTIS